jgi:hypothetical protein
MMFDATSLLINAFVTKLRAGYHRAYSDQKAYYTNFIAQAGFMALDIIANSDALYHTIEHTILVTLIGQEILYGKFLKEGGVSCEDWLHFMISLVCHDIGYIKGACWHDQPTEGLYATGFDKMRVFLPASATCASLAPYHVDRGQLFIEERYGYQSRMIDTEVLKRNIELTRFPIPHTQDHPDTIQYPGLIRAADLIAQLGDPSYLKKTPALFYEFEEIGLNQVLRFRSLEEFRKYYPDFFWQASYPYIQKAIEYLDFTAEGKQILSNLYSNLNRYQSSSQENWKSWLQQG